MGLTNKEQRALYESALQSVYKNETTREEVPVVDVEDSENLDKIEAIVMDYIQNATNGSVNESTSDEDLNQAIFEAVQNLNSLCQMVNEYFDYQG